MNRAARILMALAGLVWLATLALLLDLRSSDPAGNALTSVFAAIGKVTP